MGSATGTGAQTGVGIGTENVTVFVYGTFVATYSIEVSHNGSSYVPARSVDGTLLTGLTTTSCFELQGRCETVRLNVTAYTSGTVNAAARVADRAW